MNPLAGSLPESALAQQAVTDKTRQIRRSQALARDTALEGDHLEHQVESPDSVSSVHEEPPRERQPGRRKRQSRRPAREDRDETHIDVKA